MTDNIDNKDNIISKESILAAIDRIAVNKIQTIKPVDIKNYQPTPLAEITNIKPSPLEYIFYPCLPRQGIGFIYAASGIGKTLFTMNLAYAIAGGGSFLKYRCPQPRKVLYIDAEMAFNQLHQRIMLIKAEQGDLDFPDNLHILTPDKIAPYAIPQIDTPEGQTIYMELINTNNYEVIIFDNLSMLASFDENKSHEWKKIQTWLSLLRAQGRSTIIVHHAGKDKTSYRGTSRMLDAADFAISLQPIFDELAEESRVQEKRFKIVYQKARSFGGSDVMPYEVILSNNRWSYQSMENSSLQDIVQCIKSKMTQRDIAKELNISQTTVNRLLMKARKLGMLPE